MDAEQDAAVGPGLPSPRVAAALVLGVLAYGVMLGNAVAPDRADAGGRPVWTVVAQAPAPVAVAAEPAPAETTTPEAPSPEPDTSGDVAEPEPAPGPEEPAPEAPAAEKPAATDDPATAPAPAPTHPPVKHIWVIALTGHSFPETFGAASPAPYLAQELRAKGTLLPWYHAAGHDPAAGGVALLGGQKDGAGPFDDQTPTLADQLSSAGQSWRAYVEGATAGLTPGDSPCAVAGRAAAAQSVLAVHDDHRRLGLPGSPSPRSWPRTSTDSASAPAFSYILPGRRARRLDVAGRRRRVAEDDVPTILDSKAYDDGGLVVITFDAGAPDDAEAGGGRVGALLLSPFVTAGGTVERAVRPVLAAELDPGPLRPLAAPGLRRKDTTLKPFGPKVYAAWSPDGRFLTVVHQPFTAGQPRGHTADTVAAEDAATRRPLPAGHSPAHGGLEVARPRRHAPAVASGHRAGGADRRHRRRGPAEPLGAAVDRRQQPQQHDLQGPHRQGQGRSGRS